MATLTTQLDNGKVTALAPWADSISKAVAALAIGLYTCGFLIVLLHHSRYGFIGGSLFRPHMIAAGAWFCFFLAPPVAAATRYRTVPWATVARESFDLWFGSFVIGLPFTYLLFELSGVTPSIIGNPWSFLAGYPWWFIIGGMLVVAIKLLSQMLKSQLARIVEIVVSVLFSLCFLSLTIDNRTFGLGTVTTWFVVVTLVTIVWLKVWEEDLQWTFMFKLDEPEEWMMPLLTVFFLLLTFSYIYYPHLKAYLGGGAPVAVTIGFTKDSAISPNKALSARLIEEADEGFYILGLGESRAVYIPRNAVSFIYFSDKSSESQLLRDSK